MTLKILKMKKLKKVVLCLFIFILILLSISIPYQKIHNINKWNQNLDSFFILTFEIFDNVIVKECEKTNGIFSPPAINVYLSPNYVDFDTFISNPEHFSKYFPDYEATEQSYKEYVLHYITNIFTYTFMQLPKTWVNETGLASFNADITIYISLSNENITNKNDIKNFDSFVKCFDLTLRNTKYNNEELYILTDTEGTILDVIEMYKELNNHFDTVGWDVDLYEKMEEDKYLNFFKNLMSKLEIDIDIKKE